MKTIIVSVDKTGHVNQCLAFCEAAGWEPEAVARIPSPARMTGAWERLALTLRRRLATLRNAPRRRETDRLRIVASGGAAEAVVASYRRLYGDDLFAVFSGRPRWRETIFDVALVAHHSLEGEETPETASFPAAREVAMRRGVLTRRIDAASNRTAGAGGVAALIGGLNKAFLIDPDRIVEQLRALSERRRGAPLSIAFSRRTDRRVEALLRRALGGSAKMIDRADRAGFEAMMAEAAEYVVTPDSLTMICEACATGRPVSVFDLACFDPSASTARLVRDFLARGYVGLAPDGLPEGCPAGLFAVPPQALAAYAAWEGGTRSEGCRDRAPAPQARAVPAHAD
jgi:mitochondrial fission protein ELM1